MINNAGSTEIAAGQNVGKYGQYFSAIPIVGQLISGALGAVGGALSAQGAKKQAEQAERIRLNTLALQKQHLRPEFANKLRIDKMGYLSGLPAYEQSKSALGEQTASQMRTIQEYSPNGASTVAAISAALGQQDKASADLGIKNMEYKASQLDKIGNTSWNIGEKQRELENILDTKKQQGFTAAAAMENAATANKQNAANTILGSLSSTAASIASNAQSNKNQQAETNKWDALIKAMNGKSNPQVGGGGNGENKAEPDPNYQPYNPSGIVDAKVMAGSGDDKSASSSGLDAATQGEYNSLLDKQANGTLTQSEQQRLDEIKSMMIKNPMGNTTQMGGMFNFGGNNGASGSGGATAQDAMSGSDMGAGGGK